MTRIASIGLCLGLFTLSSLAGAQDARTEGTACRRIRAEIDLSQGTIRGNFGLNGSAVFTRDGQGTAPPTAQPVTGVFSGLLAFSTPSGTLTLRETGMFSSRTDNPDGAVLTSWADSPVGTGAFEGVTGDLFFAGRTRDGVMLVEVSGQLCRP